ncbi:MAG: WGR domain-containing protein [Silvanigrellaceae bacterium]|nr:WGR domain-containing protein [Silvanigrellaceae bacterium]
MDFFPLLDLNIEKYHALRFEKETRYYAASLNKDLLNDWTIVITNGRINSRLGQTRTLAFQNFAEAFEQLCLIAKIRHQRGYHCAHYNSDATLFSLLIAVLSVGDQVAALSRPLSIKKLRPVQTKITAQISCQQLAFFL